MCTLFLRRPRYPHRPKYMEHPLRFLTLSKDLHPTFATLANIMFWMQKHFQIGRAAAMKVLLDFEQNQEQ